MSAARAEPGPALEAGLMPITTVGVTWWCIRDTAHPFVRQSPECKWLVSPCRDREHCATRSRYDGAGVDLPSSPEPESRHRACWYGRRAPGLPPEVSFQTVEDGELLYCGHPMLFPVVGYHFDVRNCASCDWFKMKKTRV